MRSSARATAEVMAQVLRTTSSLAFSDGLNPAQWAALRYFDQAAPSARSVVAFARYRGTTKGTASQTIAALLKKGLLERRRSERDRRTVSLSLTPDGQATLENDPLNELTAAMASLNEDDHQVMARALDHVLRELLVSRDRRRDEQGESVPERAREAGD